MPSESSSAADAAKYCMSCGHPREAHGEKGCKCHLCAGFFDPDGEDAKRLLSPEGSASSSPDDECETCGHYRANHGPGACLGCRSGASFHPFIPAEPAPMRLQMAGAKMAPRPAEPDEMCQCGHPRRMHSGDREEGCRGCAPASMGRHPFMPIPAEPEPATCVVQWHVHTGGPKDAWLSTCRAEPAEPEQCPTQFPEGQCAGTRKHPGDCTPNADDIALPPEPKAPKPSGCIECGQSLTLAQSWYAKGGEGPWCSRCALGKGRLPEAPESPPCPSCAQRAGDWFDRSVCAEPCGSAHNRCANCGAVTGDACPNEAPKAQPPRRPPYAVAYATQDGTQYEVALPGDATVCAQEGALVITHTSPIAGLVQIRPMEGA